MIIVQLTAPKRSIIEFVQVWTINNFVSDLNYPSTLPRIRKTIVKVELLRRAICVQEQSFPRYVNFDLFYQQQNSQEVEVFHFLFFLQLDLCAVRLLDPTTRQSPRQDQLRCDFRRHILFGHYKVSSCLMPNNSRVNI